MGGPHRIAEMIPGTWRDSPDLEDRVVLLFRGRVEPGTGPVQGAPEWLSDAERGRAEGYRFDVDRHRYLARTVLRRRILGRLLDLDPARVRFVAGAQGKPQLDPSQDSTLRFNASHSGGWILLAVARREVGVDVQERLPLDELEAMARKIMHPSEAAAWAPLAGEDRIQAFYRLWCRKEAALKALGEGFARDPATIRVGCEESQLGKPWCATDPLLASFGSLADLSAPSGLAAAICAAGRDWRIVEGPMLDWS